MNSIWHPGHPADDIRRGEQSGASSRLEDLRARAKRRTARRQAPGRGGEVPERHRTVRPYELFPTNSRSRARLFLTGFVALLLVELMGFGVLYYEDWLRVRELEAGNERLVAAIEEHKADAIEISRLMEEDRKILVSVAGDWNAWCDLHANVLYYILLAAAL